MADLAEHFFPVDNPFSLRNTYKYMNTYGDVRNPNWLARTLLRRGMIVYGRQPLVQVLRVEDLAKQDGLFWVEEPGLRVHFRLPGDALPEGPLEISARGQTFAPRKIGLGFIRLSGFTLDHAAGPLPVPQHGSVSTARGHHWIIEDCCVSQSNGVGIDLGLQSWDTAPTGPSGYHVLRRNHIRHCGLCGIAGSLGVTHTLLEDNLFENIGTLDLKKVFEGGGIKFHLARHTLVRGNVFRNFPHVRGIWLDVENINCRITNNVFTNLTTLVGAIHSEMNFQRNLIDHNVIWGIHRPDDASEEITAIGSGLVADCNDGLIVTHNCFGGIDGFAILFSLNQAERSSEGRTAICRDNEILGNFFAQTPRRIFLARREHNTSDANLFDIDNATVPSGSPFRPRQSCKTSTDGNDPSTSISSPYKHPSSPILTRKHSC